MRKRNLALMLGVLLFGGFALTAGAEETESGESILYENSRLGYSIELPAGFQENCSIVSYRTEDCFVFDKSAASGYGGNLMYIAAVDVEDADEMIEFTGSGRILFQNETYALISGDPTDVQYNWEDEDEIKAYEEYASQCREALEKVRIIEELDYEALAHYSLEVSMESRTFHDETDGGISLESSIDQLQVEGAVWEGEFDGLNQDLADLLERERERGIELLSEKSDLFSGGKVSMKVTNEVKFANERILSILTTFSFGSEADGDGILETEEGHTFRSDGGRERGIPLSLHDILRNYERFYQTLMTELSQREALGELVDGWRNQAAVISSYDAEQEEIPEFYADQDGIHLLFCGRSAEKIFLDTETVHEVFLPFARYLDVFAPYIFDYGDPEKIEVSDADGLLDAIGSNRVIILQPGIYDLTLAMEKHTYPERDLYGYTERVLEQRWKESHPCLRYAYGSLTIRDITGMTIEGADPAQETRIVVDDPGSEVLSFADCDKICLRGLTLGHEVEPGTCSGSVLRFQSSVNITLEEMDLYGSGTYGIEAVSSSTVTVRDTEIHDCTYGILSLVDSYAFDFSSCSFKNNSNYTLLSLDEYSMVLFTGCSFEGNEGPLFTLYEDEYPNITFEDCAFGPAEKAYVEENRKYCEIRGEIRDLSAAPDMAAEGFLWKDGEEKVFHAVASDPTDAMFDTESSVAVRKIGGNSYVFRGMPFEEEICLEGLLAEENEGRTLLFRDPNAHSVGTILMVFSSGGEVDHLRYEFGDHAVIFR